VLGFCEREAPLSLERLRDGLLAADRPLFEEHLVELRRARPITAEYRLLGDDQRLRVVQLRLVPRDERGTVVARGIVTSAAPVCSPQDGDGEELTARQLEVLALIADGLRTKEIAERLTISPITVRHHVSAVFAALGVRSRLEAVTAARRRGLI
jgi:DNA-binding CsgD family transcriptional regulator